MSQIQIQGDHSKRKKIPVDLDLRCSFSITALFRWFFSLLLPASEATSHTVPFITSAYSTNLLLPYTQSDRLRPQKFNKSQSFVLV